MDFDRRTGARLSNYASALQSVEIVLFTRLGERVMRREFGAGLIELLGRLLNERLFSAYTLLLAAAIDLWEPRFRVRRVSAGGTVDQIRTGRASFAVEVDYRPNAHLGDETVESVRTFGLRFGPGARVLA